MYAPSPLEEGRGKILDLRFKGVEARKVVSGKNLSRSVSSVKVEEARQLAFDAFNLRL